MNELRDMIDICGLSSSRIVSRNELLHYILVIFIFCGGIMSFIESYKRLDNLCKDIFQSEVGITTYIYNLESIRNTAHKVVNLDSDCRKLKHYRYIRNQIVHDNNANEANMCDENDTFWLKQFHQRILNQTDPIALYQKSITKNQQVASKSKKKMRPAQSNIKNRRTVNSKILLITILIALIVISAILLLM